MDEDLWLEDVEGTAALDWVRNQNDRSLAILEAEPGYGDMETAAREILTSQDRIPYGPIRDGFVWNFWQDDVHVRGLWRRSDADAYRAGEPAWETILDIDQLAEDEDENWVFAGASPWRPEDAASNRYLLSFSVGGRDATTVREFDVDRRAFVGAEEGGFVSAEAKQGMAWLDADTVLIATEIGNNPMTDSGYPIAVRRWERGAALAEAPELFRGVTSDVVIWPVVFRRHDGTRIAGVIQRQTFFTSTLYLLVSGQAEPLAVPVPAKADIASLVEDQVIVSLRQEWSTGGTTHGAGDIVSFDLATLLATGEVGEVQSVFSPSPRQSVTQTASSGGRLLLFTTDTVAARAASVERGADGMWQHTPIELPGDGSAGVVFSDPRTSEVFVTYQDHLTPDSLFELDGTHLTTMASAPRWFDADKLVASQRFATSADGTQIPYFLVHRKDLVADGETPTLLYGYGGFEVSMSPSYSGTIGRLWLEEGGAYAIANIRGGGEFGPSWHQAGLKQNRQVIYDDFISVAEDLIASSVTSPRRLGIMGGSNGGLLMGVMLTQRPELWNAAVIQVPLLDMLRYHLLLAGASWVDEYGSPDVPDERAFLETISPYHQFDAAADYPEPFFVTSTKDDRVHPGHARKMARRFEEAGKAFLYYENIDGGHGAAANQNERARRVALEFAYLRRQLM